MAAAYLGSQARIIQVPGQRDIEARVVRVSGDDQTRARAAIDSAADIPDVRKILVFVNSRRQVDSAANHFQHGAFAKVPVYGHHGSLSRYERERVEEQFRQDTRAICVATMTLEVGIDIGDVDLVVCMDPPFTCSNSVSKLCGRRERTGWI
ncbi:MAG: hypothetical protein MUE50_26290 [Pirellulaceae bacterium]|jgi:ATP-dependent Lhr-like helicase|nr:hypothetical protein [Pirellulaceae bacterium]